MKILVTGSTGFLGKNVCKLLKMNDIDFITTSLSKGLDLRKEEETLIFFAENKPDYVLNCAAYVGGIQFGYKHFGEIFANNLKITLNLLEACKINNVKRLVNPISNCAYPAQATLFKENEFWDGPLHESVMVYGFVRKAFWIGGWAYNYQYNLDIVNIILSNMYGPDDHFEEERSHALGALIMKFIKAKELDLPSVTVWGTGKPVREWLYVVDGAEAMIRSLNIDKHIDPINIGIASGISIIDLANLIKNEVGYKGEIILDSTKPDGAEYKTVDGGKGEIIFKWKPQTDLKYGIKQTIKWYLLNKINYDRNY